MVRFCLHSPDTVLYASVMNIMEQILHAIVLDIKFIITRGMQYSGQVEYCHSEGSNKPDI